MKKNEGWNMQKINFVWAKMKQKDKRQFIPTNPQSGVKRKTRKKRQKGGDVATFSTITELKNLLNREGGVTSLELIQPHFEDVIGLEHKYRQRAEYHKIDNDNIGQRIQLNILVPKEDGTFKKKEKVFTMTNFAADYGARQNIILAMINDAGAEANPDEEDYKTELKYVQSGDDGFNRNALHLMALKNAAYWKEFEQLLNDMSEHDIGMLRISINQKDDLGNTPVDLVWKHWSHNESAIRMIDVIQEKGGRASKYAAEVEKLMENRR